MNRRPYRPHCRETHVIGRTTWVCVYLASDPHRHHYFVKAGTR